jgi:tungstate transport system substrate-binding protein
MVGAAACSSKSTPILGVESVLAQTGLMDRLLEDTKVSIVVGETQPLLAKLESGEIDLAVTNGDLETDALLRKGAAASAVPIFHGEMVLVGPKEDPMGIHAERTLENSLRLIVSGDAAFFRCTGCGSRSREDAIFAVATGLPRRGPSFIDVGPTEEDVLKAMHNSPGYGLLSRPIVFKRLEQKEWAFKPLWSGDALQVDTYRVVVRPPEKIPSERREAVKALAQQLQGEKARAHIEEVREGSQPVFKAGAAQPGQGARFQ